MVSMEEAFTAAGITADLAGAVFKVVVSMAAVAASAVAVVPFMAVAAFMVAVAFMAAVALAAGLAITDRQECKSWIAA